MRNISIRIPEAPLLWIDEQIKKVGRFGSRADVFREALTQFMNPTISLELRKVINVREDLHLLIETTEYHSPVFLCDGDNLSVNVGSQLIVFDFIEPRKFLLKIYSEDATTSKKAFLDAERKEQEWQDVK